MSSAENTIEYKIFRTENSCHYLLVNSVYAKKELKISLFSLTLVTNLISSNSDEIQGIFFIIQ